MLTTRISPETLEWISDRIDPGKLAALSPAFERSISQRLGYLPERGGDSQRSKSLHEALSKNLPLPWPAIDVLRVLNADNAQRAVADLGQAGQLA